MAASRADSQICKITFSPPKGQKVTTHFSLRAFGLKTYPGLLPCLVSQLTLLAELICLQTRTTSLKEGQPRDKGQIGYVLRCIYLSVCVCVFIQATVSVHNPSFYSRRFQDFMTTQVFKKDKSKSCGIILLLHMYRACTLCTYKIFVPVTFTLKF